jgi:hypothetical protein
LSKAATAGGIDWISPSSPNFDEQDQNPGLSTGFFGDAGIFAQN